MFNKALLTCSTSGSCLEEEDDFVDASVVDTAAVAATEAADLSSVVVSPLFGNRTEKQHLCRVSTGPRFDLRDRAVTLLDFQIGVS